MLPAVIAHQARADGLEALRLDRHVAVGTVLGPQLDEQQPQEVIDLGQRGDRALASAAAGALLDGDRGRDAEDGVHIRARSRLHELARIGVERFQVAPLAFGEQDIEGERALAAARNSGDHRELLARNLHVHVLEIVLARVVDMDGAVAQAHAGRCRNWKILASMQRVQSGLRDRQIHQSRPVVPQSYARIRARVRGHLLRRTGTHDFAAGVTALGAQVDDPVGGADHVEVMLDYHQRMSCRNQLTKGSQQLGDVVEVQPGGRFIEQEQAPAPVRRR